MIPVYKTSFRVRWDDVDSRNRLRFWAAASYFQEAAASHAESLALGFEATKSRNKVWVLARLWIRMTSGAGWREEIELSTWPQAIEKLFALRGFAIHGADGRPIAEGSSAWILLDLETHRPLRPGNNIPEGIPFTDKGPRTVLEPTAAGLSQPADGFEVSGTRPVLYADIDMNLHVNNAAYIRWAFDLLPDGWEDAGASEIFINFQTELGSGDRVQLWRCPEGSSWLVGMRRLDGEVPGPSACVAKIVLSPV